MVHESRSIKTARAIDACVHAFCDDNPKAEIAYYIEPLMFEYASPLGLSVAFMRRMSKYIIGVRTPEQAADLEDRINKALDNPDLLRNVRGKTEMVPYPIKLKTIQAEGDLVLKEGTAIKAQKVDRNQAIRIVMDQQDKATKNDLEDLAEAKAKLEKDPRNEELKEKVEICQKYYDDACKPYQEAIAAINALDDSVKVLRYRYITGTSYRLHWYNPSEHERQQTCLGDVVIVVSKMPVQVSEPPKRKPRLAAPKGTPVCSVGGIQIFIP